MKNRSSAFACLCLSITLFSSTVFAAQDCNKAVGLSVEAAAVMTTNPALAADRLREAIAACDTSASLYYNLGIALYTDAKYEDATQSLERALQIKPSYAKAANDLAFIYAVHLSDRSKARTYSRQAVQLDPTNQEYQKTLVLAMQEEKKDVDIEKPPVLGARRPDAVGVIIGNRTYKDGGIPAVDYAYQDAALMRKYLTDTLGFKDSNIIYLQDAEEIDLKKVFGDKDDHRGSLYSRTRKDVSEIFIFYSGHGGPDPNTREAYLIPANADPFAIRFTSYPLNTLYENLSKLTQDKNPLSVVVVLDACFSGSTQSGMLIKDASPIAIEVTSPLLKIRNAVLFTSSQGNQISSWYPEKKHGLFTYQFLKAIKEGIEEKKDVTAAEIEKSLLGSDGVNDTARRLYNREQVPQVVGNKGIVLVK